MSGEFYFFFGSPTMGEGMIVNEPGYNGSRQMLQFLLEFRIFFPPSNHKKIILKKKDLIWYFVFNCFPYIRCEPFTFFMLPPTNHEFWRGNFIFSFFYQCAINGHSNRQISKNKKVQSVQRLSSLARVIRVFTKLPELLLLYFMIPKKRRKQK